tara:strand:- start:923 stop:1840 length:918 start_codon:yes stop_codon:yes gene_type:complete
MAISRAQLAKELEPGLNSLFGMEYDQHGQEYSEIFQMENSSKAFEEEVLIVGFGAAPDKSEGQSVVFDNAKESYTARYNHSTVALAFALTEEAIEDNLYDSLGKRYTKALARSMAHSKEVTAANILNNAFSSSHTGGDGKSLINTAHPLSGGGTDANRATTMADLNETSLEAALVDLSTFTDDRGLNISVMASKLVIPPQLIFVADRLLASANRTGTADNDINAIKNTGMIPGGYVVNHHLTDVDGFFLTTSITDQGEGLKGFQRSAMSTSMEPDFATGNIRYKARERYSFGFSNWRGVYGSQGA